MWRNLTLDKLELAEQQLSALTQGIVAEDYVSSVSQLESLNEQIQQLFLAPNSIEPINYARLRALSVNFAKLIDDLSKRRYQIKDSISQIASVKSENKVTRTYHIDRNR